MKCLKELKIALITVGIWALSGCATATDLIAPKAPMTPEHLLKVLVQIATEEDLADEKRIGSLLGLDIVMIPEPPFEMKDGRMALSATGEIFRNPVYLSKLGDKLQYRNTTQPIRGAGLSLNFNHEIFCINYKEVIGQFKKHGDLKPSMPPLVTPLPNGAKPASANPRSQPAYGFGFSASRSNVSLVFYYTECLTSINIRQPNSNQ